MNIQRLPPDVAAKIAAGEVVERPANAAKELIENSVDAGATEIRVEIREGGQRLLRVMDNGCGIPADEVPLAVERHATSKVRQLEDLGRITTFGFRGEALYSIAAVSRFTLSSRCQDEQAGVELRVEGSRVLGQKPIGLPVGTVVAVEHLFYNVPARQKYLRTATTEAGHIRSTVQRLALANPDRRFSLIVDGRLVFQSTGSGDPHDVLAKIYSLEDARQLIPVGKYAVDGREDPDDLPEEIDFMHALVRPHPPSDRAPVLVAGYVSQPTLTRANRSYIDLFVNRRHVEDRTLTHAVVQAYHTLLPVGRYPIAALFIEVPPHLLDVNVHPRKAEVRFQQKREVFAAVQRAVRRVVVDAAAVPGMRVPGAGILDRSDRGEGSWQARTPLRFDQPATHHGRLDLFTSQPASLEAMPAAQPPDERDQLDRPGGAAAAVHGTHATGTTRPEEETPDEQRRLPPLRVVGQVGSMYVVAEGPEGLFLIDQHAAHERILYEQFMAQRQTQEIPRQGLLEPLTLHVGDERAGLVSEHLEVLNAVGFVVEPFGGETFLVRAVPSALSEREAGRLLDEMLQGLTRDRNVVGDELEARLVKMVCKRASIKAGQILSDLEMKELLRQLEDCRSPRTCPHGRPTMVQLAASELEKAFKRT